jgi:hypothetical protein
MMADARFHARPGVAAHSASLLHAAGAVMPLAHERALAAGETPMPHDERPREPELLALLLLRPE